MLAYSLPPILVIVVPELLVWEAIQKVSTVFDKLFLGQVFIATTLNNVFVEELLMMSMFVRVSFREIQLTLFCESKQGSFSFLFQLSACHGHECRESHTCCTPCRLSSTSLDTIVALDRPRSSVTSRNEFFCPNLLKKEGKGIDGATRRWLTEAMQQCNRPHFQWETKANERVSRKRGSLVAISFASK